MSPSVSPKDRGSILSLFRGGIAKTTVGYIAVRSALGLAMHTLIFLIPQVIFNIILIFDRFGTSANGYFTRLPPNFLNGWTATFIFSSVCCQLGQLLN
jgi:hypothetical protein